MKSRGKWLIPLILGTLILATTPQSTQATIEGNSYIFSAIWNEQTYQENGGPIYQSGSSGQFIVTVYNVTESGGEDVYEYNYNGFNYFITPFPVDQNESVAFQNNKVDFTLYTTDSNSNNRSESTDLDVFPQASFANPGEHLFVNPVWSTHNTDWNTAQTDVENDTTVIQGLTAFTNTGSGTFGFTIVVNTEGTVNVGGTLQDVNGSQTYTFSAAYDPDGVLLNWRLADRTQWINENYTLDQTLVNSILRTSSVGPTPAPLSPELLTTIIVAVIVLVAGVLIGFFVGKRRGTQSR